MPGTEEHKVTMVIIFPLLTVLLLGTNTVQGSLMSRIGLRLSGKKIHEHHKNRVPWAVKQMREDPAAEERKPWQDSRTSKWWVVWGCFFSVYVIL